MTRHDRNGSARPLCRRADRTEDFDRLGLDPDTIAAWEDGMRTAGGAGSYEWWYFDAHLEDGASLVIAFYTKNPLRPQGPLDPYVSVQLEQPGHEALSFEAHAASGDFSAAESRCEVKVGESSFSGDLRDYEIHVEHQAVMIDVRLSAQVRSWRPGTGHVYFGKHDEHFFAWLPSVPQGTVSVAMSQNGRRTRRSGIGYHDHNWGDVPMPQLINHWYWGRAQAGPYSIISSYVTAEHRYGDVEIPTFLLAKGSQVIADDPDKVRFRLEGEHIDTASAKPVADIVVYEYEDCDELYRVSFRREETIAERELIDEISGVKHVLARIARFDGAYLRFTGPVQLERLVSGEKVEDVADPGIWELMYLGRTH